MVAGSWRHLGLALVVGVGGAWLPAVARADLALERESAGDLGSLAIAAVSWGVAAVATIAALAGRLAVPQRARPGHRGDPAPPAGGPAAPPGHRVRALGGGLLQVGIGVLFIVGLTGVMHRLWPGSPLPPGWTITRPPYEVSALALQGDIVWAGGRDGLVGIDRLAATPRPAPPGQPPLRAVKALLVDRRNCLWIAHDGGLTRYAAGVWTTFSPADGGPPGPAAALHEDRNGRLWIGHLQGVTRYDGRTFQTMTARDGLGLPAVDVIFQDGEGAFWFGSSSPSQGGLTRYDGRTWRTYAVPDGLAHPSVNAIIEDRQGALWVATGFGNRGGASRLAAGQWTTWTRQDGLAGEKVRSLFEDRAGRLWFGSEYDGIAVHDGAGWRRLTPNDGLAGWEVKVMAQDADGAYWLGTENGVSRIPGL